MNEFISSLFQNKKQKMVWIIYVSLVVIAVISNNIEMSKDTLQARLCKSGYARIEGLEVDCGVNWLGIASASVVFGVVAKLFQNK